ncbi:MAG: hypothetical protein V3T81_02820 [Thermoanaerobaculia bacterium]
MSGVSVSARPAAAPAPPEGVSERRNHALSSRVRGLSCPSCGGALEFDAGLRVVTCPYCDTPLLAVHELGVRRLAVEPRLEAGKAREIARRWLTSGFNKSSRLKRDAWMGEAFLTFLPFFRVEADCIGFALGTERKRRTVGSGKSRRTVTYEVDVERSVEKSFDRTYPALNVAEWGLQRVDLQGGSLVPFDAGALERLGMVFPPTVSEVAVVEAALQQFKRESDPAAGLHRVRFRFLRTLRERTSVIYYPLWVVRYRFQKRAYQVLVDAEDGSLDYGKAPGNDIYRVVMMVVTQAAALFVGTTLLQYWGGGFEWLVFIGLAMLAVLWWGWRKFRYGGVVVEGTGVETRPGLTEPIRSLRKARSASEALRWLSQGGLGP